MKDLLEYIVKALVENPDEVEITEEEEEEGKIVLKLKVADDDKGRIIGKKGRIAESLRAILRVKAVKTDTHVFLDIV
ncbi:MAG: KH domain-containing protein [Dehalococcoidia bacterium]|tara:strand:+ start:137 stop:367 length:231 start_codon:yes stop_codon:yes gene_type:complete